MRLSLGIRCDMRITMKCLEISMINLTLDSLHPPKYGSDQADLNVNKINLNYLNSSQDSFLILVIAYDFADFLQLDLCQYNRYNKMLRSTGSQFGKTFTPARKQLQLCECAGQIQELNPLRIMTALNKIVKVQNGRKFWQKSAQLPANDQSNIRKTRNMRNNNSYSNKTPQICKQYETTNHRQRVRKRHTNSQQHSQFFGEEQQLGQLMMKARNKNLHAFYDVSNKNQLKWDVNNYDQAINEFKLSVEQRSRKMSIKTKLEPVCYQKVEHPEVLVGLINKFKFQNLKIVPFSNNSSEYIVQTDRQINQSYLIATKKQNPPLFKYSCKTEERKMTSLIDKTIDKNVYKSKSREKAKKLSNTSNLIRTSPSVISPWMTLSDQYNTNQLLEQ